MAPRKRTGRAAAEAAYATLLKDNTALVGDVGEAYDAYIAKHQEAVLARQRYEQARVSAVKAGAVTTDQLEQMGYKKTPKLPAPPATSAAVSTEDDAARPAAHASAPQTNGAPPGPALASVGAASRGEQS